MTKKKKAIQEITADADPIAFEHISFESNLRTNLEEIKKCDGVIGYILRNATSASVDFDDPAEIADFALLSSSTFDANRELAEIFNLGDIKNVIVEGKKLKMLSVTIDQNRIDVFLEKSVDVEEILRKMQAS